MVDLFHNLREKSRLAHSYSLKFLLSCTIFLIAAVAYGGEPSASAGAYLYPQIAYFGALNTINGVHIDEARVVLEMNFNRQAAGGRQPVEARLEIIPDVATAANLVRQRQLHGLSITGIDYILMRELVAIRPLYVASASTTSPLESYLVLTRKEVDLEKLSNMAERRLMVENHSLWDIGRIWLETELHKKQLPNSEIFFTAIQPADKPIRLVLPVFFGQAEACLVPESTYKTMVELNPQIDQKLRILIRSPGVIKSLACFADYLDPDFVAAAKEKLHTMHLTDDGRQLMMIFRLKKYFPYKPEDLIDTEDILNQYRTMNPEFAAQYLRHQIDEPIICAQ
jgi:ABC-type phosphate/phosphonate transport system substrate-binding protein